MDRGALPFDGRRLEQTNLSDLLARYREVVPPRKRGSLRERYRIDQLLKAPLGWEAVSAKPDDAPSRMVASLGP